MPDPKPKDKGLADQLAEKAVNKAADMFLEPILAYIGQLCNEFSGYLCNFDEHVLDLEDDMVELNGTRERLKRKFRAVSRSINEYTKFEVWCKKEEQIRAYADKLVEQGNKEDGRLCLGKGCVRRFYGKNVFKCRDRVRRLKDEGEKLIDEELLEKGAPDDQGESFLDNLPLAVGLGASCSNEAPPQPQQQPRPQPA